jgi:3-oxoacyl-[acyl-carrier protein] reductase
MEFADKTVVVTGASGVFGRWIAEAFWREGARVVLADMRVEPAEAIVTANGVGRDRALVQGVDLTREDSILALGDAVRARWGAPDILVNNAGVYPKGGLLDIPAAEWDRIMGVNLRAPFLVTRMFARDMIAAGKTGSVVMISSGAARQMRNGSVPYCTSKTAIERLAKGFALELAPHGIRVNVVEPGFAPGSVVSPLPDDYVTRMNARIPLGRSSGPEDAPGAILYLCSARAGFITGATLSVDGGNSIGTYEPGELGKAR